MKTLFNYGSTVPTAFVTRGKQRVKQYNNDTVYLNNGDEFEIELFNPTTNKVLAKIELNGVSIGSGIVLRPGERVHLERYINDSRKFLFETYTVNGKNEQVQKAIENNGKVTVMFYCEEIHMNNITVTGGQPWTWTYTTSYPPYQPSPNITYGARDREIISTNCFMSSAESFTSYASGDIVCGSLTESKPNMNKRKSEIIETGRVEKGSNSNQSFGYDSSHFNSWWSWKTEWKILPLSQKPLVREDLKVFCTNCGAKRKKNSHLYCPLCGVKY